jgi:hypothetical protein
MRQFEYLELDKFQVSFLSGGKSVFCIRRNTNSELRVFNADLFICFGTNEGVAIAWVKAFLIGNIMSLIADDFA